MGNYEDNGSLFIGNRLFNGGGGCYFLQITSSYFYNTRFLWNYVSLKGGAIALTQQSNAVLDNVSFVQCSSDKGGVLFVSERSSFLIKNSINY